MILVAVGALARKIFAEGGLERQAEEIALVDVAPGERLIELRIGHVDAHIEIMVLPPQGDAGGKLTGSFPDFGVGTQRRSVSQRVDFAAPPLRKVAVELGSGGCAERLEHVVVLAPQELAVRQAPERRISFHLGQAVARFRRERRNLGQKLLETLALKRPKRRVERSDTSLDPADVDGFAGLDKDRLEDVFLPPVIAVS